MYKMSKFDEVDMRNLAEQFTGTSFGKDDWRFSFGDNALRYSCTVRNLSYMNFAVVARDMDGVAGIVPKWNSSSIPIEVYRDEAYDINPLTFFKYSLQFAINDYSRLQYGNWAEDWKKDIEVALKNNNILPEPTDASGRARHAKLEDLLWQQMVDVLGEEKAKPHFKQFKDSGGITAYYKANPKLFNSILRHQQENTAFHKGLHVNFKAIEDELRRNKIVICPLMSPKMGHAMSLIFLPTKRGSKMFFLDPDEDYGSVHREEILNNIERKWFEDTRVQLIVEKKHLLPVNKCLRNSVVQATPGMSGFGDTGTALTICFTHYLILIYAMHVLCCEVECDNDPEKLVDSFYKKYAPPFDTDKLVNGFIETAREAQRRAVTKSRAKAAGLAALGLYGAHRFLNSNSNRNYNKNYNRNVNVNRNINVNRYDREYDRYDRSWSRRRKRRSRRRSRRTRKKF